MKVNLPPDPPGGYGKTNTMAAPPKGAIGQGPAPTPQPKPSSTSQAATPSGQAAGQP